MMIEGQEEDLSLKQCKAMDDAERLLRSYRLKSGALYAAAAKLGALLWGASDSDCQVLERCGMKLGLLYQFHDDIADVLATEEEVGKETGQDATKLTAVDLYGVQGTECRAKDLVDAALDELKQYGDKAGLLRDLVCRASWAAA